MSRLRSLLFLGLAGLSVLSSTAFYPQLPPPTAPAPVYPLHIEPAARQALGRVEAGRSGADDEYVDLQRGHYKGCIAIRTRPGRLRPYARALPSFPFP